VPDRYEPRLLSEDGPVPLWGVWITTDGDWLRDPGPSREPRWFVTESSAGSYVARSNREAAATGRP
jgi:hypothetical protein